MPRVLLYDHYILIFCPLCLSSEYTSTEIRFVWRRQTIVWCRQTIVWQQQTINKQRRTMQKSEQKHEQRRPAHRPAHRTSRLTFPPQAQCKENLSQPIQRRRIIEDLPRETTARSAKRPLQHQGIKRNKRKRKP